MRNGQKEDDFFLKTSKDFYYQSYPIKKKHYFCPLLKLQLST